MKKNQMKKIIPIGILLILLISQLSGCDMINSEVNDVVGKIRGNTYTGKFYTNTGDNFMTVKGQKIDMNANIIKEKTYNSSDGWGYSQTLSSVVTITIDGDQIETCGSSVIFEQEGLKPDAEFKESDIRDINSNADGIMDNTSIANIVNRYKNAFGKPTVVVIQSQLGDPICAYSGESVYWEVCEDLPKTTKLMIDGKALYIHRANFAIIDKNLLE